jgi:Transposase
MGSARRQYTEAFKLEAVRLPARRIARELGIAASRLRAWRNKCDGGACGIAAAPQSAGGDPAWPVRIWSPKTPVCGAMSAFIWLGRF